MMTVIAVALGATLGCGRSHRAPVVEEYDDGHHGDPPAVGETGEDLPGEWSVDPDSDGTILETPPTGRDDCSSLEPFAAAWNGEEILLAYVECEGDTYETKLVRVDRFGDAIGDPIDAPGLPMPGSGSVAITWTDVRWAAIFSADRSGEREIYLRPVEDGLSLGDELRLTDNPVPADLDGAAWLGAAWLGESIGIAHRIGGASTFMRAEPLGGVDAASVRSLAYDWSQSRSVIARDGRLVVGLADFREGQADPHVAIIGADGEPETADTIRLALTESGSSAPLLASTLDGFMAAFEETVGTTVDGTEIQGVRGLRAEVTGNPSTDRSGRSSRTRGRPGRRATTIRLEPTGPSRC